MVSEIIKFLYVPNTYTIFTFLSKLFKELQLDENESFKQVKTIQTYPVNKPADKFGLRIETKTQHISCAINKAQRWKKGKQFPTVRVEESEIIFIPSRLIDETLIACEIKEGSPYKNCVLEIYNADGLDMFDILKMFAIDYQVELSGVFIGRQDFYVSFNNIQLAQKATELLLKDYNRVNRADIYIAAVKSLNNGRKRAISNNNDDKDEEIKQLKERINKLELDIAQSKQSKQQEAKVTVDEVSQSFKKKRTVSVDGNKQVVVTRQTPYSPVPLLNYNVPFQFNSQMLQGTEQNNMQPFVICPMMMMNPWNFNNMN